MSESRGFTVGHLVIAFLAGATAGAVAALLTAPKSGRESRAALREFAADARRRATAGAGRVLDRAESAARAAKSKFVEAAAGPEARDDA